MCGGVAVARERRYILSNEAEDGLERGVFEERACERVEKKRVDELCGLESFFKPCAQLLCDLRACLVPCHFSVCVGDEMRECGLGGLEGHGHAIAGEGRDDRV